MTILEAKKPARGLFSIYKPGQGKWVRWGTVVGMAIVVLSGTWWLTGKELAASEVYVRAIVGASWTILGALLTLWVVNSANLAEFMIMTESEMRKVTWPTRREVFTSTKVVIIMTVILGVLLYLVDVGFLAFFKWLGIA